MIKNWFSVKRIEDFIQDDRSKLTQHRTLTLRDIILLGIGVIIGTGIFVLTGHAAARNAGPAISISFIIAGCAAGLSGLCYAEMAAMMPIAGSAYTYAYAAIGELGAYLLGWALILEYLVGAATVCAGWSGYFVSFLSRIFHISLPQPWTTSPLSWDAHQEVFTYTQAYLNLPAALFALLIGMSLIRGTRKSALLNAWIVGIKLLAIGLFLIFSVAYIHPEFWVPFLPANRGVFGQYGWSGLMQGATLVFFSYIGFDAISSVAQECKNPQRDLPLGMFISLILCTCLYVLVSLALTGLVHYSQLNVPHPIAVAIEHMNMPWLEILIDLGAMSGLTSGAMVMLLGQPRIFYAMARDGLIPRFALKLESRNGTPYVTTILNALICAIVAGLCPIELLGEMTSMGTLLAFTLVSISVPIMRLRAPLHPRAFRVPAGPYIIPMISSALSLTLLCTASRRSLVRLLLWMLAGFLTYIFYASKHSKLRLSKIQDQ
jgi:APA family basic amino acid/polyamine antiporter